MADSIFRSLTAGISLKKAKHSKAATFGDEKDSVNGPPDRTGSTSKPETAREKISEGEKASKIRRRHRINIHRKALSNIPGPIEEFGDLLSGQAKGVKNDSTRSVVPNWVVENIKGLNIEKPTPIQMQVIPMVLNGYNVVASAPTGSGKTLAFLIPLIVKLKAPGKEFSRSVILCPTRELAIQIHKVFERLRGTKSFRSRILDKLVTNTDNAIKRLDVAISTPLRMIQMCRNGQADFSACRYLILDEADKLLDLGFAAQIDELLTYLTNPAMEIQLFCATMSDNVVHLSDTIMNNPVRVSVGTSNAAAHGIKQSLVFVTSEQGKLEAFRQLVDQGKIVPPTLVFVDKKERAKQLFNELIYDGIFVDIIHSNRTRQQRDAVVESFRTGKTWVLICTDLMGRGLDVKGVSVVINFDFPKSTADYIHRIGRTGRAGRIGTSITFYTLEDIPLLSVVVNVMRQSGCDIPPWLSKVSKLKYEDRQALKSGKRRRKAITR